MDTSQTLQILLDAPRILRSKTVRILDMSTRLWGTWLETLSSLDRFCRLDVDGTGKILSRGEQQ